jgi:Tol biopolymer transport system component
MKGRFALTCLPAALLALASFGAAAAAPIHLSDFRMLVQIGGARFSPDGAQLAFIAARSDFIHDRYAGTLYVTPIKGGEPRILVADIPELGAPQWSPDGRTIAFLGAVDDRQTQVYTVPAAGGTPTELSDATNGVEQYEWSPDGNTIAYVTPDDSPLSAKDVRTHNDLFTIHDDDYLVDKPSVPSHIWLLSVKTGKARQLTRGSASALETAPPISGGITAPSWSADGRWIVYNQQADADDSDSDRTTIVAVNVVSAPLRPNGHTSTRRGSRRRVTRSLIFTCTDPERSATTTCSSPRPKAALPGTSVLTWIETFPLISRGCRTAAVSCSWQMIMLAPSSTSSLSMVRVMH